MKTTKKSAAKKLKTMSRKLESMCDALVELREEGGKDAEGLDVVYVSELLERAFRLRYELDRSAASLVAPPEPVRKTVDVYEVLEEQNDAALRRMA